MQRSDHNLDMLLKSIKTLDEKYKRKRTSSFVFTKIPRTASSSLSEELRMRVKGFVRCGRLSMLTQLLSANKIEELNFDLNHMRIQVAVCRSSRIKELIESHFCFLFVRNPWDRMVSLWKLHSLSIIPNAVNKQGLYFNLSFSEFVYRYLNDKRSDKESDLNVIKKLNRQLGDSQWRWMHLWIDYIGRYENLQKDFYEIAKYLNLKNLERGIQYRIKRYNISPKEKDYRLYYNDKLKELVENHYLIDCKLFGYKFDSIYKTRNEMQEDVINYMKKLINNKEY